MAHTGRLEPVVEPAPSSVQTAVKDQSRSPDVTSPPLPSSTLQVHIPPSALSPASSPLRSTSSGSGWDFDDDILDPEIHLGLPEAAGSASPVRADSAVESLANTLKASSLADDVPKIKAEEDEEALRSHIAPAKQSAVHVKNESLDVQLPVPSLQVSSPSPTPSPNVELASLPSVKKEEEDEEVLLDDEEAEAAWELDQAEAELELELANDEVAAETTNVEMTREAPDEPVAATKYAESEVTIQQPKSEDPYSTEDDYAGKRRRRLVCCSH
jgi:hypothetical protein